MVIYDDLESFNKYKDTFKRFKKVVVTETKYSIKIDYGKKKVFLNEGGENKNTSVLGLINRIKRDAQNYLEQVDINSVKSNDIFWYYYNDKNNILGSGKEAEVGKIDLTSAYWTRGLNDSIISKETNDYFDTLEFEDVKEKKGARLKALGSLATVKKTTVYNYGKKDSELQPLIFNEDYRSIYMGICNGVAEDMQTVLCHVEGVYYYWDCIFIEPQYIEAVIKLFKNLGYNCTVEKHKASVFKSKYISYFCCPNKDGVMVQYPIN